MKRFIRFTVGVIALAVCATASLPAADMLYAGKRPIRVLLITGGCCHNYAFQSQAMAQGISKQANVEWTILQDPNTGTRAQIPLYDNPRWAKPFDVIIHNECFADTDSQEYVKKITAAHRAGKPAMVIHCAMHTYRAGKFDDWREFLGVTSRRHDHQSRYPVRVVAPEHPIMKGFPTNWVTPMDELYIIEKLWPGAKALAMSTSEKSQQEQPVIWVNQYGKARVFGTTYGHSDDTFRDPVFIDLLARGLVWSAGKLK
jgi:type 1 glutamine amidotransferase